jgi:pimeloyl-ACP methyl ester carboxylesterase
VGGVPPATLPAAADSASADSPVLLVRVSDGALTPVLAEVDANTDDLEDQALILRPQVALDPSEAYVVLLRDGLRTPAGEPHTPSEAFRALRDELPTDSEVVEGMREEAAVVNGVIADLGLDPGEVVLGWSFHTRSAERLVGPLLAMHDITAAAALTSWTPVSDSHDGENRLIEGTIEVPDFLGEGGRIALDEGGAPVVQGSREVEFLVTIPDTVVEPRPVMLFGHGFFSAKEETTWSSLQHSLQPWAFSAVSTDFIGFNEDDLVTTLGALTGDLEALQSVMDQQLQSHTHFTALARLVREQLADDISEDRGAGAFSPLDGDRLHYLGISNGGTQGAVILAASPEIDRGALVVPGGAWSHMLQRAVQWTTMGGIISEKYRDPLELQLVLALTQQMLDPADALNYVEGLDDTPFEGRSQKAVTLHMAVGDCQVSNMVTEWVALAAGVPLVTPSAREIWGLTTVEAPEPGREDLRSALFVYDEGYDPLPESNLPPTEDNGAHETIRYLDAYRDQVGAFLETGAVVQVCEGACDPD